MPRLAPPLRLFVLFGAPFFVRLASMKGAALQGHRHMEDRDDLTGEHKLGDIGQVVAALIFIVVWILDVFLLRWTTFLDDLIPLWIRIPVGVLLLIPSLLLAWKSTAIVFGEVREPPDVIRTGLYAIIRHPMYLSEIMLYCAIFCVSMSLAAFGVLLIALVFLRFLCRFEERLLISRFGNDYRRYMRDVPMWIPNVRRVIRSISWTRGDV